MVPGFNPWLGRILQATWPKRRWRRNQGNLKSLQIPHIKLVGKLCVFYLYQIYPVVFLYHSLHTFSSVQFSHSVMSDSLWSHESQHTRPPCPSPTPRVHSNSRPSSRWCHPAISSSGDPSPPAPNPSQHQSLFQWVNSSYEVAKGLEFQL